MSSVEKTFNRLFGDCRFSLFIHTAVRKFVQQRNRPVGQKRLRIYFPVHLGGHDPSCERDYTVWLKPVFVGCNSRYIHFFS